MVDRRRWDRNGRWSEDSDSVLRPSGYEEPKPIIASLEACYHDLGEINGPGSVFRGVEMSTILPTETNRKPWLDSLLD